MAKLLKIALLIVGSLIGLLIVALLVASLLFDPNDYRSRIQDLVKDKTGRELVLGDIKLKIFPWLRVAIADVKLGNAKNFGPQPFAQLGSVSVGVKVLPLLLRQQVEVSTLELDDLHVHLAKNKDGVSNWQDLAGTQEKPEQKLPEEPKREDSSQWLNSIGIEGVDIQNGHVVYDDAQAGQHYELKQLRLQTGPMSTDAPVTVDLTSKVVSKAQAANVDLALTGTIKPDLKAQKIDTENLKLNVKGKASGYDLNTTIKTRVIADLTAQAYDLKALAVDTDVQGQSIPGGSQHVVLNGDVAYQGAQATLQAKTTLKAAGLTLTSNINGSELAGDHPRFAGPVDVAQFNVRKLLEAFGTKLETTDTNALTQVSFHAKYSGGTHDAKLKDVAITLDQSKIKGEIDVRDFTTQAVTYALTLDNIDADRYLAPKAVQQTEADPAAARRTLDATELPAQALQELNAEGTFEINKLKVNGLSLSDVKLRTSGNGAQATKQQTLSAKLYRGTLDLTHRFTPGASPSYAIKTDLASLEVGPFLKDFTGNEKLSGIANFNTDVVGQGKTVGELRRTLSGKLSTTATKGAIKGFNLGRIMRQGQAALAGNLNYKEDSTPETDFSTLQFSGTIRKGILHNEDLKATSPLFLVTGAGDINLIDETLNYTAKTTVLDSSNGPDGGKTLAALNGATVPIRLKGSLYEPNYKLEFEHMVKQKLTAELKDLIKNSGAQQKLDEGKQKAVEAKQKATEESKKKVDEAKQKAAAETKKQLKAGKKKLGNKLSNIFDK